MHTHWMRESLVTHWFQVVWVKCISLTGTGQAVKDIRLRVKEYELTIPVAQRYVLDMKQCLKERINQCRVVLRKRTSFQAGSLNENRPF
jgi:hypothetical protein